MAGVLLLAHSSYLFTSESVSEGHPDKVCDRVSDEIVDLYFRRAIEQGDDRSAVRVAAETLATTNRVIIAGETRGSETVTKDEIEAVARAAIEDIGYEQDGFHHAKADVEVLLHGQSAHIAQGVDGVGNQEEGAGDQGIMFGYACRETPTLMPAPIHYSHMILKRLAEVRHDGSESWLGPDSKSQVTVRYENGVPVKIDSIVVSTQHLDAALESDEIRHKIAPYVMVGVIMWTAVLKSGVHATLAGVALAAFIPIRDTNDPDRSPLRDLEKLINLPGSRG